jgi:hypothetical protein
MAMADVAAVQAEDTRARRYESLMRIANSVRAGKSPEDLFRVLARSCAR